MDKNQLPSNIRSIIISIDDELKDSFNQSTNEFISNIQSILEYYQPTIYNRIFKKEIDDVHINIFLNRRNNFINKLSIGINSRLDMIISKMNDDNIDSFYTKEFLYEEIMEQVAKFIITAYNELLLEYAAINDYPIWIFNKFNQNEVVNQLMKIIDKPILYDSQFFDIFTTTIQVVDQFIDISIPITKDLIINCNHLPKPIVNDVKKLLYQLAKYKQFITTNDLEFKSEIYKESFLSYKPYQIDISQGYSEIYYNIIYALLKDKLLKIYDESLWQDLFAKALRVNSLADGISITDYYFYHPRAKLNHIEYFMSCIIAYIQDSEKLKIGDLIAYRHIQRILEGDNL